MHPNISVDLEIQEWESKHCNHVTSWFLYILQNKDVERVSSEQGHKKPSAVLGNTPSSTQQGIGKGQDWISLKHLNISKDS